MKTNLCKPVLIKGDKSFLYLHSGKLYNNRTTMHIPDGKQIPLQLILISLDSDEKIEDEDKYIHKQNNVYRILECISNVLPMDAKKVIATQSQLSPEYIQQFIEEYNKGEVEDVEIECPQCKEWGYINSCRKDCNQKFLQPKLTKEGFVTIVKEKPTYQQIIDTCGGEESFCKLTGITKELITYTEEEVYNLFENYRVYINELSSNVRTSKIKLSIWFEQNRKK